MFNRSTLARQSSRRHATPTALLEALEGRQMLAHSQTVMVGGGTWDLTLTGPGTFADVTPNAFGIPLIALTGTTLASNFSITPTAPVSDRIFAQLNVEKITGGTLNSIALDPSTVRLITQSIAAPRGGVPAETGILLTGYAKTITVGDMLGADIRMDSTSSQNRSDITARFITGDGGINGLGQLPDVSNITSGGVIESFTALNYRIGKIQAARIGSILIQNDLQAARRGNISLAADFDIETTSRTATFGVKSIQITGQIFDGDWEITAPVQKISLGDVFNNDFQRGGSSSFTVNVQGRIGQFICLNDLRGTANAASFGSVQVSRFLDMSLNTDAAASDTANSIDSIRAERLEGDISVTNGIGLINAGSIGFNNIDAGWIDTINVTGAPFTSEVISSSSISFNNVNRQSVNKKINVQGIVSTSTINSTKDLGDITVRGLTNSRILVGVGNITSLPTTLGAFVVNSTIKSFTMTAPFNNNPNFVNSIVVAAIFGKLTVTKPNVTTNNGGSLFGIAANTMGPVSYTAGPGINFSSASLTSSSAVNVGDFQITAI